MTGTPARRVVLAEDEALIRMDLAEMLGEEGYVVVGQAGDGATAVSLVEELRPDLAIFDVKMPVLDGISAAQRVASQRIAPVVILTAFSQRDLVERAREAAYESVRAGHPLSAMSDHRSVRLVHVRPRTAESARSSSR